MKKEFKSKYKLFEIEGDMFGTINRKLKEN